MAGDGLRARAAERRAPAMAHALRPDAWRHAAPPTRPPGAAGGRGDREGRNLKIRQGGTRTAAFSWSIPQPFATARLIIIRMVVYLATGANISW